MSRGGDREIAQQTLFVIERRSQPIESKGLQPDVLLFSCFALGLAFFGFASYYKLDDINHGGWAEIGILLFILPTFIVVSFLAAAWIFIDLNGLRKVRPPRYDQTYLVWQIIALGLLAVLQGIRPPPFGNYKSRQNEWYMTYLSEYQISAHYLLVMVAFVSCLGRQMRRSRAGTRSARG